MSLSPKDRVAALDIHTPRHSRGNFASYTPGATGDKEIRHYELGCPVRKDATREAKRVQSWNKNPCPASG